MHTTKDILSNTNTHKPNLILNSKYYYFVPKIKFGLKLILKPKD